MTPFETTVSMFRADAVKMFKDAHDEVALGLKIVELPPPLEEREQKKLDAAKAKLAAEQGKLTIAIKQLDYAEQLQSDQDGRDGYKSVVRLMTATAATAEIVCEKIRDVVTGKIGRAHV